MSTPTPSTSSTANVSTSDYPTESKLMPGASPAKVKEPPVPVCPVCGKPLEVYVGDNLLKAGTGWCKTDGRQPLKG